MFFCVFVLFVCLSFFSFEEYFIKRTTCIHNNAHEIVPFFQLIFFLFLLFLLFCYFFCYFFSFFPLFFLSSFPDFSAFFFARFEIGGR